MSKSYSQVIRFYDLLKDELKNSTKIYGREDAALLKQYYSHFHNREHYYYFTRHYSALRILHLIKHVKKGTTILDAGTGTGSQAILCGILGGQVVGIDISIDHINLARKRKIYYEQILNIEMDVNFYSRDILKQFGNYDIIWVNEAISHIEPVEIFLKISYNNLNEGGKLIIADGNKLNPLVYLEAKRGRKRENKGKTYRTMKDPETGEPTISMAIERIFTIPAIKTLFSEHFQSIQVNLLGYFPFFLYRNISRICKVIEETILRKIPLINLISGAYVLTCTKISNIKKLRIQN